MDRNFQLAVQPPKTALAIAVADQLALYNLANPCPTQMRSKSITKPSPTISC
jgi:hypothetical protein